MDCYDGQGRLILKRGTVVDSLKQLEFLLDRGLFDLNATSESDDESADLPHIERAKSPFKQLSECHLQLESILLGNGIANEGAEKASSPGFASPTQLLTDFLDGKDIALTDVDSETPHPFSGQILQLAADLQALCVSDADAVIGAIHLDMIGHRYSISHSVSRALICEFLAARCRIPPRNRRQLMAAALTCDMSLLHAQDELVRYEGPLNQTHRQVIVEHPQQTVILLAALGISDPSWTNAVIQHHECPDGQGYPAGLSENAISPWARILKLADAYSAMISQRSYRKAFQSKDIFRQFFQRRGKEFDAELAALLVNEFGVFPPGLLVRLHSNEQAVVVRRGVHPRAPIVKAVVGSRGALLTSPLLRITDAPEYEIVDILEANSVGNIDLNELWDYEEERV